MQRVPKTESQGRIHTSTATVLCMPEVEAEDFDIDMNDLEIETMRSSGAGGQHINKPIQRFVLSTNLQVL